MEDSEEALEAVLEDIAEALEEEDSEDAGILASNRLQRRKNVTAHSALDVPVLLGVAKKQVQYFFSYIVWCII